MKTLPLFFVAALLLATSCDKHDHWPNGEGHPVNHVKKYPADVAIKWVNLQQKLIKKTPGFDPAVAARSFAYSGLTLYEAVVKGMPGYRSVASPRIGTNINEVPHQQIIHWAASANAAMASILKGLFASTSPANKATIDSLELALAHQYEQESNATIAQQSADYGRNIGNQIFEWSKTDGGHEAYLKATSDTYVPPTGPGMWIPTPSAFSAAYRPYWGNNRAFVTNSAATTMPGPPPVYSEDTTSVFYKMVDEVYQRSKSLTEDDIKVVRNWADLPGNYGTPAHYTHIATQLIEKNKLKLDQTAFIYARHGIALNEALICVLKAKYTYNLIRPVSYIRGVMGMTTWNTVIGTPPHPEYPSAHATIGGASVAILESAFGKNYSFIDRTHENLYGARSYNNLRAYALEAAESRVIGGIHYSVSADVGMQQGEEVGELVKSIRFR